MSSSGDPSPSRIPQLSLLPTIRPTLEKSDRVAVWRLPSEISQSRLGGRTSPSNACTLIALQLVELFERRDLHFVAPSQSPRAPLTAISHSSRRALAGAEYLPPAMCTRYLVGTFIEAMVEGNEAHERAIQTRGEAEQNFTIPDAIAALKRPLTEIDFCPVTGSFSTQLPRFVRIAMNSPSLLALERLHFVIIAFERSVLLVADRTTHSFMVLDSHLHGFAFAPTTGAVIAAAHFSELAVITQWMAEHIFPETHITTIVQEFEISTVAYSGAARDCAEVWSTRRPPPPVSQMRPMTIFNPTTSKENRPPCINSQSAQRPQHPNNKLGKRSAESPERALCSKRVRSGSEAVSQTTVAVLID